MSRSETTGAAKLAAIAAYLLAAICGAVGQFCFKQFAGQLAESSAGDLAASPYLWIAICAYFAVMGLFVVGLRLWGELSTLYPVYGSTFVFALLLAALWLDEPITAGAVAGSALIIVGIVLLNVKSGRPSKEAP